jgi:hypothetical protein
MKESKKMANENINERVVITPPNFQTGIFEIRGTAPLVQHKFSKKAQQKMLDKNLQAEGTKGKTKKPRNIEQEYKEAMHIGEDGKHGIPCTAFRCALIEACRAANFVMTKAKMSIFCLPDTIDNEDKTPLVHLIGKPEMVQHHVRLERGVSSVAIRPMFKEWSATIKLQWDADQFDIEAIANLIMRAGLQVGIGEGRPFSKKSAGMGWGTFELITSGENASV